MSILEKNLSVRPELKELYEKFSGSKYEVEITKNNQRTFRVSDKYVHSAYNPEREATRSVELLTKIEEESQEIDVYLLLGNGLGYTAVQLYRKIIKESQANIKPYILWIEKDPASFICALENADLSELLQSDNVRIFVDTPKDVVGSFLQTIATKRIRYSYLRPLYFANESYYQELQNYIAYVLDRKDMNSATLIRFQRTWARNNIYNLPYSVVAGKISDLKNIALGCTAVLIAGGPTLEKMLPFIKQYRDNLLLVAVDTAYKYLRSHGVSPDIVVSVDPQFWNYKYLEGESLEGSILVTDSSAYHKTFENVDPRRVFTGDSLFEVTKYFLGGSSRGTLAAGGSVATTAFDIARTIGATSIIFAGLDLSFPNRNTHFRGAFFEHNFIATSSYIDTADKKSDDYIAHTGVLNQVVSTTGESVITDPKMILFQRWIEKEINVTNARVVLPNLGGARIEGANIVEFEQLPREIQGVSLEGFHERVELLIQNNNKNIVDTNLPARLREFLDCINTIAKHSKEIVKLIPDSGDISQKSIARADTLQQEVFENPRYMRVTSILASSAQDVLLSIVENVSYASRGIAKRIYG